MHDYNSIIKSIKEFLMDSTSEISAPDTYRKGKKQITDMTSLRRDMDLDSLDMYQMGYEMEKKFNISVPDEKIADIDTIGDLAHLIESYLNKK